ncbi:MAG: DNA translocase FtsK, partial [Candidatus Falkowbacteria bacterium]|nr:DNA translocase FtsK [Candidatus Falkowbacteria bacterium]
IEAPIPGKALVGIEIPNQKKALVSLREILTDPSFKKTEGNLVIGLGKDVAGKVWVDNLAKMPHVIVAGATNSGKSVCLNTIIVSLLYRNNPDELRFIMVDPKRVELTVYNDIPHLLCPVITDVAKTINALKWCLNEMDKRFEYLSKKGKRNIQSYNEGLKGHDQKMPYIIFVIDELADLMVSAKKDVEAAIIRLAQMARAVGIHLILATQRPSTDVITGLIKANTPARIAFAVASGIDSRTILDSIGAEDLLGQGDMLITTPSISQPKRLQGAYLSDIEIKRIVRYIKEQVNGETFYLDAIMQAQKVRGVGNMGIGRNSSDDGGEDSDSLFLESKELVVNAGKASASLLQRRLSVGYARAARIMDLLEEAGIIGPANGAKPRDILISKEELNVETSFTPLHNPKDFARPQKYLDNKADDHFNEEEPGLPPVFKKEKKDKYVTPENNPEKSLASFDYDEYEKEDDNNNDFSSNQEDKILDDDKELIQPKNKVNLEDNGKYFSK